MIALYINHLKNETNVCLRQVPSDPKNNLHRKLIPCILLTVYEVANKATCNILLTNNKFNENNKNKII